MTWTKGSGCGLSVTKRPETFMYICMYVCTTNTLFNSPNGHTNRNARCESAIKGNIDKEGDTREGKQYIK